MKKVLFALTVVAMLFSACSSDEEDVNFFDGNELKGDIVEDVSLSASIEYKLTGTLSIKDGGILRIPAGTVIKANKGFANYVIVEQGGQIFAEGTSGKPVKFTSGASSPAAADWGGLIINGYAPISGATSGTEGQTEVNEDLPYGGNVVADNSGVLTYVILEYTGARSNEDVEHNGLTLNGVGNGTRIENIYIPNGADDGVEFFGGSVNVKNLLVVNPDDDMFDVTQGWTGTLDNCYGVWESGYTSTESDPRGVEADGNLDGKGEDHVDQSNFKIKNMTIVNESAYEMNDVIKIRRGATATITNALAIGGTTGDMVDLTDSRGGANAATSISLTIQDVTGNQLKEDGNGDNVSFATGNTGATTSVFDWTSYGF